jgi:single-stranded-DNA-specific exonuclease
VNCYKFLKPTENQNPNLFSINHIKYLFSLQQQKPIMQYKWIIKPSGSSEDKEKLISEGLNVSNTILDMLIQRGIKSYKEAESFFNPKLENLHHPFLMKDMDKAINRLENALNNNEKILVFGDYDVDGTTSVAMVYSFLSQISSNIDFYIPDRYSEGYGVSFKGIDYASENGFTLIIALDCGIKANEKVEYANQKKIDFIVCDHHNPGEILPNAVAILDPKREDCNYPYKDLSGCGVGFKLLQALCLNRGISNDKLWDVLDLVAVSIASDIVGITGENRILATFGIKKLKEKPRTGLKALIDIAGHTAEDITISDIVFKIGPRINAAGRIESGRSAVKLLIEENSEFASEMSNKINKHNETRQNLDQIITKEALEMIDGSELLKSRKSTVLFKPDWHKGVVGIVASRVIETWYKPTIILTESNGIATGSARSVDGFDLYQAIDSCSDLLSSFGGHKHAAGLSMKIEDVEKFAERFEEFVCQNITEEQLIPQIKIDHCINLSEITPRFYNTIKRFAPFGPGNMSPVYMSENVRDTGGTRIVGKTEEHLRFEIAGSDNTKFVGIGFGLAHCLNLIKENDTFKICYSIEENDFNGNVSLQLRVRDVKSNEDV